MMNRVFLSVLLLFLIGVSSPVLSQDDSSKIVVKGERTGDDFYHTIERGETVYAIATMYGVSTEDIYRLNPDSRNGIKAGAQLRIPQLKKSEKRKETENYIFHTIQPRETLYSVSRHYMVAAASIIKANPGLSTETFISGKTIRIPAIIYTEETTVENKDGQQETQKTLYAEYTVERKETMYRLCRKFDISSYELLRLNPQLKKGVKAGMVIKVPAKGVEVAVETRQPVEQAVEATEQEVNAMLSAPKDAAYVNSIKVALMLPFKADQPVRNSQTARFVEYYEGFLLAVDSLRNMGCSIDLHVYDMGDGVKKTREILQDEALKEMNLIIGAVHNEQIGEVARFAQENKIRYVIPFTSKNDDVLSNSFVYQVNTPHSYLYDKAAQAGCDLFAKDNIILLNIKDKGQKKDFIKAFKEEMKQRNISYTEMAYNEETFATEIESQFKPEMRNVIVPTSGSLDALKSIKSPLRVYAETKPEYMLTLFGYPEWQTYTRECLDEFHALNTYIYSNFYADNLSHEMAVFYNKYKTWYSKNLINTFPKYGILGFDTGMYFLNAIKLYGTNFEDKLEKYDYKSIQTSFDFHRVNNWGGFVNTNIFIVHYQPDYNVTRHEVK